MFRAKASLAIALTAGSLVACTSTAQSAAPTPAAAVTFLTQDGFQPSNAGQPCLLHQTTPPGGAFAGGPSATLLVELPFLAYLRANGNKAFCDAKPASDIDKQWAALYVKLTDNAPDVKGITG